jgi:hypothetical protein
MSEKGDQQIRHDTRQETYGTLRRVRLTTAAVEKQYVLNIMSACLYFCLSNSACK